MIERHHKRHRAAGGSNRRPSSTIGGRYAPSSSRRARCLLAVALSARRAFHFADAASSRQHNAPCARAPERCARHANRLMSEPRQIEHARASAAARAAACAGEEKSRRMASPIARFKRSAWASTHRALVVRAMNFGNHHACRFRKPRVGGGLQICEQHHGMLCGVARSREAARFGEILENWLALSEIAASRGGL